MKQQTIHEKAIRLIEGGHVSVDGHSVRLRRTNDAFLSCYACLMDCLCHVGSEMCSVCSECDRLTDEHFYLELVTNDKEIKQ